MGGVSGNNSESGGSTNRELGIEKNYKTKISKKAKDKVKTDQARDGSQKLTDAKVKNISPIFALANPAFAIPTLIANSKPGKAFRQNTAEVNKKFFKEKVLTSKNRSGYTNTLDSYSSYMKDRSSGRTDAYGNVNSSSNRDSNTQSNQFVSPSIERSITDKRLITSSPTTAEVSQATATNATEPSATYSPGETLLANNKKGRRSTILQKAKGLGDSNLNTTKRTLGA